MPTIRRTGSQGNSSSAAAQTEIAPAAAAEREANSFRRIRLFLLVVTPLIAAGIIYSLLSVEDAGYGIDVNVLTIGLAFWWLEHVPQRGLMWLSAHVDSQLLRWVLMAVIILVGGLMFGFGLGNEIPMPNSVVGSVGLGLTYFLTLMLPKRFHEQIWVQIAVLTVGLTIMTNVFINTQYVFLWVAAICLSIGFTTAFVLHLPDLLMRTSLEKN